MELIQNIRADHEAQMLVELGSIASRHVEASGGTLELLENDPDKYPGQHGYYVSGDPQSSAIIETIAATAFEKFPVLQEQVADAEVSHLEISRVGELLKAGNNVILATTHGDLIDIALVQAAVYSALEKQQYEANTAIIISKAISLIGYKLGNNIAPTVEVLKILCNDIFLSFPRTDTIRKSRLSRLLPDDIKRHNKQMTELVESRLDLGGMLLAIAASGTIDKPSDESYPDTYLLGTIGHGTAKMMMHPKTLVMPVAVWLKDENPILEIADIPRVVTDEADAHAVMIKMADKLSQRVEGKTFKYDPQHLVDSATPKGS
jgi:hypothetical protein